MKSGIKSSEFWVTLVIVILGLLGSAGVVADGSTTAQVVGFVTALLAGMGYTGVRGSLKKIEATKNADTKDDSGSDS